MKKAIIIMLYGTSTSGKTTICSHLQKLCASLKIDGTDLAFKRLEEHSHEKLIKYINQCQGVFPYLNEIQQVFTEQEICHGIIHEAVRIENQDLSLMFESADDVFENALDNFLINHHIQLPLPNKKALLRLRQLADHYFDEIYTLVHEEMFDLAIRNSNQQQPTILDIIPHPSHPGQFMVELFRKHLHKRGHVGPTHIALLHCSIHELSDRMLERNHRAVISKNLKNVRDKPFPFKQYAQLFGVHSTVYSEPIGVLNMIEAKKSIRPFSNNFPEINKIIEQIGFNQENSADINISCKCEYDQVYDTDCQNSQTIAANIFELMNQVNAQN